MRDGQARTDRGLEQRLTLAALVLSIAYATLVIVQSSPVSFYTLDDPYIHMALAENIARGHFGVNLGEASNPSSSILWPWLMAVAEKLGVMLWAPLIINITSFALSLRLLLSFTVKRLAPDGANSTNALIFAGLGFLSFNLFGVVFTGMEHSLHTLVSVVAVTRVIDRKYDWLTFLALVTCPLLRFEGTLLLAFGLCGAIHDRRWLFAILAFVGVALVIGIYQTWLAGLGLPALPSSVLSKSTLSSGLVDDGQASLMSVLGNAGEKVQSESFPMFAVFAAVLVYACIRQQGRDRLIAIGMLGVLATAFVMGIKDTSYARYDVYVLCVTGAATIHLLQGELRALLSRRLIAVLLGGALVAINLAAGPRVALTTPTAARNIDRQQRQMHRFVTECWKKPVAVNDLGWVSFRNDLYVLDLVGLGSEEARKLRAAGGPDWMNRLVAEHGVDVAMIYPDWLLDPPGAWAPVGDLLLQDPKITPASNTVRFYATRPEARASIADCLRQLAATLPEGVAIRLAE